MFVEHRSDHILCLHSSKVAFLLLVTSVNIASILSFCTFTWVFSLTHLLCLFKLNLESIPSNFSLVEFSWDWGFDDLPVSTWLWCSSFLQSPCAFTLEPAITLPNCGCYFGIGQPDIPWRVSISPYGNHRCWSFLCPLMCKSTKTLICLPSFDLFSICSYHQHFTALRADNGNERDYVCPLDSHGILQIYTNSVLSLRLSWGAVG